MTKVLSVTRKILSKHAFIFTTITGKRFVDSYITTICMNNIE